MGTEVYFVDDEPALAARLHTYLVGLGQRLGESTAAVGTVALVLSGGYGRGEVGVFRDEADQAGLYNDLEFYMLLRDAGAEAAARAWCEIEEPAGTTELGIDVEVKRMPIGELHTAMPTMFYYDLVAGHRLIWGHKSWLQGLPSNLNDASQIPLHEATRLMFNRGSGLFYSRCALAKQDERLGNGFVARNQAKVKLALGDAVLVANGQYHHFARERNRRVQAGLADTPPDWDRLVAWHTAGVDFKMHPRHVTTSREEFTQIQAELAAAWQTTFRWLEERRLGRVFETPTAYTDGPGRRYPETGRIKNVLLHLRDLKSRAGALPGWTDYPRGALQRGLVHLIDPAAEPDVAVAQRTLGINEPVSHWTDLEGPYRRWWAYYN